MWLAPYVATFLFLWISPATVTIEGMRYLIPMVMIAPLMLGMLGAGEQQTAHRQLRMSGKARINLKPVKAVLMLFTGFKFGVN